MLSNNIFTIKTKDPDNVARIQKKSKGIIISGLTVLQDVVALNDFIFVVFGGDNPKWETGLVGFGHITELPFDVQGKSYSVKIDIDSYFKPLKRIDFVPYPQTYGTIGIAPIVKWEPNQAITQVERQNAVAVLQAIAELREEVRTELNNAIGNQITDIESKVSRFIIGKSDLFSTDITIDSNKKLVFEDKNTIRNFAYGVFKKLHEEDKFSCIGSCIKVAQKRFSITNDKNIFLTGIFCANPENERWFNEPFDYQGRQLWFSTQWYEEEFGPNTTTRWQLSLVHVNRLIQLFYPQFEIEYKKGGPYKLYRIESQMKLIPIHNCTKGFNVQYPLQLIYFGAPGTSKSTTIKRETEDKGKEVHRITFHPDTDYSNFVGCYKPTKSEGESQITYKFVAQTFINAYVSAWKQLSAKKEVFLVIEEINRGNCAQIFGDLFQLLDRRKDGYSDYEIEPDSDLQDYLKNTLQNEDLPELIKSGKKMQLPPNLFIWATMNTSDQSLFPIDSAFKRRWDWKYLPITNAKKEHIIRVKADDKAYEYDWWQFLVKVNERIESLTESEDKQLGYWFAKPNKDKQIDVDTFVGKVLFYLWNDIFKDFGDDERSPFMFKPNAYSEKKEKVTFRKFFCDEGEINTELVKQFLDSIGLKGVEVPEEEKPSSNPSNQDDSPSSADTASPENDDAEQHADEESNTTVPVGGKEEQPAMPHVQASNVGNIAPQISSVPEAEEADEDLF